MYVRRRRRVPAPPATDRDDRASFRPQCCQPRSRRARAGTSLWTATNVSRLCTRERYVSREKHYIYIVCRRRGHVGNARFPSIPRAAAAGGPPSVRRRVEFFFLFINHPGRSRPAAGRRTNCAAQQLLQRNPPSPKMQAGAAQPARPRVLSSRGSHRHQNSIT